MTKETDVPAFEPYLTNKEISVKITQRKQVERAKQQEQFHELMQQVDTLLIAQRKEAPRWHRQYKNEDPRCVHYHRMLKRIGLSEKHARYAPWFWKSQQLPVSHFSKMLFAALERDYLAIREGISSGEKAVQDYRAYLKQLDRDDIDPRDRNQVALQRAFRYCLFKTPKVNLDRIAKRQAIHVAFCDKDPEEDIPVKPLPQAAPGLAPAFGKTQESHGRHRYFNYSGRWKNGHMRGPMGTYHFADGSKYTGSWKDSLQCGPGVMEYPNGCRYSGTWKEGKFDGMGTLEYKNGTKYIGGWREGIRHGKGEITFKTGAKFKGEYFLGYRQGNGIAASGKGYQYSGEWKMSRIHGAGKITFPSGKIVYRDDWGPYLLGEAIEEAKKSVWKKENDEEQAYRKLLQVRDDLRALDQHYIYKERKQREDEENERRRKQRLKALRKEKADAQKAAQEAFLNEMLGEDGEDSASEDSDESDSDAESGDDSDD